MNRLLIISILRSPQHSLPTLLTAIFCTLLLQIGVSWIDGIHSSITQSTNILHGAQRIVTKDYKKKEAFFPITSHISPLSPIFSSLPITPKLSFLSYIEKNNAQQHTSPIIGLPSSYIQQHILSHSSFQIQGSLPTKPREILLGKKLAKKLQTSLDDSIILTTQTQDMSPSAERFSVSGILTTHNTFLDQIAFISLSDAQWMTDIDDGATELLIHTHIPNIDHMTQQWSQDHSIPLTVDSWDQKEPYASIRGITNTINRSMLFFITLCAAITILNIALINMKRSERQIGILRALGATKSQVTIHLLSTASALLLLGIIIGVTVAYALINTILHQGFPLGESLQQASHSLPMAEQIYPKTGIWRTTQIILLIFGTGILGTLVPCLITLREDPIQTINRPA